MVFGRQFVKGDVKIEGDRKEGIEIKLTILKLQQMYALNFYKNVSNQ